MAKLDLILDPGARHNTRFRGFVTGTGASRSECIVGLADRVVYSWGRRGGHPRKSLLISLSISSHHVRYG
jgi:hypothetical protein